VKKRVVKAVHEALQAQRTVEETVLQEADRLIHGPRQATYSHPIEDYDCTGRLWGAMIESYFQAHGYPEFKCPDIPAELGTLMMVQVKVSREMRHEKRDNSVDAAGYVGCHDMVIQERARREGAK
jgi:hypothetical protein